MQDFSAPTRLVESVYRRVFESGISVDQAVAELVEAGNNPIASEMIAQLALERRREELEFEVLGFRDWVAEVLQDVTRGNRWVAILCVAAVIASGWAIYELAQWMHGEDVVRPVFHVVSVLAGGVVFLIGSVPIYFLTYGRRARSKASKRALAEVDRIVQEIERRSGDG